jgi:hypothetical protein
LNLEMDVNSRPVLQWWAYERGDKQVTAEPLVKAEEVIGWVV